MKENYQSTLNKLEETRIVAESLQKQNEQLLAENERQGKQLGEALHALNQAKELSASRQKKVRVMVYTTTGLILGYFFITRIIRLVLRDKPYK